MHPQVAIYFNSKFPNMPDLSDKTNYKQSLRQILKTSDCVSPTGTKKFLRKFPIFVIRT